MFGKLAKKAQGAAMKMAVKRLLKSIKTEESEIPMICIMEDRKGSLKFNLTVCKAMDGKAFIHRTIESFDLENMDLESVVTGNQQD